MTPHSAEPPGRSGLHWAGLLRNPEALTGLYATIPPLTGVTLRSLHFDRRGPGLTLRLDLPSFPDREVPQEWAERGLDRFQCQIQFLAVGDLVLDGWAPPAVADITLAPRERRRIAVTVDTPPGRTVFTSSDSLLAGRLSAYRDPADGIDRGPHAYVSRVDRIRFDGTPDVFQRDFYERV